MNALIAYYSTAEENKQSNEDKIASEIEKILKEKEINVKFFPIKTIQKMSIKEQFKKENVLELEQPLLSLNGIDLLFIGTPIVGSLTSAPALNTFIRNLPKSNETQTTKIILFSVGVIHGLEMKKMQSLLSMKALKPFEIHSFTTIFEFDSKKLAEVKQFVDNILEKMK